MLIRNDYKPRMTPAQTKKVRPVTGDRRIYFVLFCLVCALLVLVVRSVYVQYRPPEKLETHAKSIFVRSVSEPSIRGKIMDRHGALLAINEPVGDVIIDTYQLPDFAGERQKNSNKNKLRALRDIRQREQTFWKNVKEIAQIIKLPEEKALKQFDYNTYEGQQRGDVYLLRQVDKELLDRLKAYHLPGLRVTSGSLRRYPDGSLFGHVVGVTKVDIAGEGKSKKIIGLEGVEYAFDKSLRGEDGLRVLIKDNRNNFIESVDSPNNREPINGKDLMLSLDRNVQIVAMTALEKAVSYHRANSASAVVLDAHTGEILAMANYPSFDPARFSSYDAEARRNHVAVDAIEPGSVLKPLVIAKALDKKQVTPNTIINTMPYKLGESLISDVSGHDSLSVTGVIQKSSNVGASKLARQIPAQELYDYLRQLGLTAKPNSGFPGESAGVLRSWEQWQPIDHAVIGYGYGIQMSLLQLARAYTAITNDGVMLPVSIVKLGATPKGQRVLRPETARQMQHMMVEVTENGTGRRGAIEGYDVASKSGTAQKFVRQQAKDGKWQGKYTNQAHRALFVGFAPAKKPRVIVVVDVDNPRANGYYGGMVAAPVFAEIMGGALRVTGTPPTKPIPSLTKTSG